MAVSAVTTSDVWAVGTASNPDSRPTLILHWSGRSWSRVPSPSPGGGATLTGVCAVTARDVWVVGSYIRPQSHVRVTLIEHWDGTAWTQMPSPNMGSDYNILSGVSVTAGDDGWAVGSSEEGPLLLHWNGTRWAAVSETGLGQGYRLINVSASARHDAWAVGQDTGFPVQEFVVTHWDGTRWALTKSVQPPTYGDSPWMSGISARTPEDVWAAGTYVHGQHFRYKGFIEHWDGSTWQSVKAPNPGGPNGPLLTNVRADRAHDAWVVGSLKHPNLAERWDGHEWSPVRGPEPRQLGRRRRALPVRCLGRRQSWVPHLIEHWDGTHWTVS